MVCIGTGSDVGAACRHAARPNASFVTQLIATAGMAPQTRKLRRATAAAVLNGYKFVPAADTQTATAAGVRLSRVA